MNEKELWHAIDNKIISREEVIQARTMGLITAVLAKKTTRKELRELAMVLLHLKWNTRPEE